jgi:hypothetical protein
MNLVKSIICLTIFASLGVANAYDVTERFKLSEDRFKTEEMLRPFGHDFIFDVNAWANKNLTDLLDDIDDVSSQSGTDLDRINAAGDLLEKYRDTEQTVRISVNLGFPLPTFTAWGVKIVPDFRIKAGWGANMGIRAENFNISTVLNFVGDEISDTVKSAITAQFNSLSAGDDIVASACTAAGISDADCVGRGLYFVPTNTSVPVITAFTKLDVKAGPLFNFTKDDWAGAFRFYGLHRTDYYALITADQIARGQSVTDGAEELNSQVFLNFDFRIGKVIDNYSFFAKIEEIKIARLSDKISTGGDLKYGTDPLIRIHGDALYSLSAFSFKPFLGVHKRSGYSLAYSYYAGADLGAHVWGDRLGIRLRGMVDKEHLTISPQFKLWLMQLEYSLKQPLSSQVDDVKVSTLHSLNFRIFF